MSLGRRARGLLALVGLVVACSAARAQEPGAGLGAALPDASVTGTDDLAQIDDSVARLAEGAREQASKLLAAKDYAPALESLQQAHELDPRHAATAIELAQLYALLGSDARAELTYRAALALDPQQADIHIALSDLLARDAQDAARLAEAAGLLARARELRGNEAAILLRQARVAARSGREGDAGRAYAEYLERAPESDEMRLELGDFYREFGKADEALAWYRKVSSAREPARLAAQRIFELEVDREARELGLSRKDQPIPEQARALAQKGRLLAARGELVQAEQLVRRALALAPAFAPARGDLGDVLRAAGRTQEAELEYLRALALEPAQVEIHQRLSALYLAAEGGARASEAALILERALRSRPELGALHLELARAYQHAGDLPRALLHVGRFLSQAEQGPARDEALALRSLLERLLGDGARALPAQEARAVSAAPLARARTYLARGRTDAALAELRRLPEALRTSDVLELEARVLHGAGRLAEAARVLERLLSKNPSQAEAQAELGAVLLALGREPEARARFAPCAARGHLGCGLALARLDAGTDPGALGFATDAARLLPLLAARERLLALEAHAGASLQAEIHALAARVDDRLIALALFALLVLAAALAFLLGLRARLFGGADLAALVDHSPEAGPEAMRILSSIRHEVLKHNTMALSGLCEALRKGEPLGDKAGHLERALFGETGDGGARAKLHGYAEQLRGLGRAHGVRLNLEREDRALAPLLLGFRELGRARPVLRSAEALGPAARSRLLRTLEHAGVELHERGYAGVREALDHIRYFRVDAAALRGIFARTAAEPAFARANAELVLGEHAALPCRVGMPEHAFSDVLTNLLRNALEATLAQRAAGAGSVQLGIDVRAELDQATCLEQIALAVQDRAAGSLPERALRGRYIEAGLGLTADLVARYEGSLEVRDEAPAWTKAVVLRLPGAADANTELSP